MRRAQTIAVALALSLTGLIVERDAGAETGPAATPWEAASPAIGNFYASPTGATRRIQPRARDAAEHPAALCDRAIEAAARRHHVPLKLMRAVALVESGRTLRRADGGALRAAWPWTVNMEGEGRWFDTRTDALAYVRAAQRRGARSFDVGCMQVNHRWHGDAFASLEEMFEPDANADYAARFLLSLAAETGDWMAAAGRYHSRTPHFGRIYREKVAKTVASLPKRAADVALAPPSRELSAPRRASVKPARRIIVPKGDQLVAVAPTAETGRLQRDRALLRPARGRIIVAPRRATPTRPAIAAPQPIEAQTLSPRRAVAARNARSRNAQTGGAQPRSAPSRITTIRSAPRRTTANRGGVPFRLIAPSTSRNVGDAR